MSSSYIDFAESISKSIIVIIKSFYEISNYKVVYNERVKFQFTIYIDINDDKYVMDYLSHGTSLEDIARMIEMNSFIRVNIIKNGEEKKGEIYS